MPTLRPLVPTDLERIVELNNQAYPAVPVTTPEEMTALVELSSLGVVAENDGRVIGFVLAIDPGSNYTSENYTFFTERAADTGLASLYVDRVVIDVNDRGRGTGRLLYSAVFDRARADGRDEVTCEVNLDPPNPGSLAFHARLQFARVGEQPTKGGSVIVALLAAAVWKHR